MYISKYIPDRLFGFASDGISQVDIYFHLGDFSPSSLYQVDPSSFNVVDNGTFNWRSPPPVLGEVVEVLLSPNQQKASRVIRTSLPVIMSGRIDSFDQRRGYGFVAGDDRVSYHLHKSEMVNGCAQHLGSRVVFFAGTRQGKPRACHVHTCGGR